MTNWIWKTTVLEGIFQVIGTNVHASYDLEKPQGFEPVTLSIQYPLWYIQNHLEDPGVRPLDWISTVDIPTLVQWSNRGTSASPPIENTPQWCRISDISGITSDTACLCLSFSSPVPCFIHHQYAINWRAIGFILRDNNHPSAAKQTLVVSYKVINIAEKLDLEKKRITWLKLCQALVINQRRIGCFRDFLRHVSKISSSHSVTLK